MQLKQDIRRVFVTGATGFLGFRVVAALLEAEMQVTVLINPEQEDKLASLAQHVEIIYGDIWNRGSLKGLSRGHQAVVHLVGSVHADPTRGLTYQQINLVSARNAIGMAVSDGVGNFVLLSVAALPAMLPAEYIRSKREAEVYLQNSGLHGLIVRAPLLYKPRLGNPVLPFLSAMGVIPPLRWIIGKYMPLGVDAAARGIVAALQNIKAYESSILYANDLRHLAHQNAPHVPLLIRPASQARPQKNNQGDLDEIPFGWLPTSTPRRNRPRKDN
jgi:uncharacterized protein YbjT (DUF2867 family)